MTTIVTWLWQGLVIAALTALIVRTLPRLNAATRHVIWWLALVVVLIQPWTTAAPPIEVFVAPSPSELSSDPSGKRSTDDVPGLPSKMHPGALATTAAPGVLRLPTLHLPAPPEWLVLSGLALWAGLAGLNLWRMAAGVLLVQRLKNQSRPLEPLHQDRLLLWSSLRGHGRRAELRVSATATSPGALGLGRAVILIPRGLAARLSDRDLDLIVTHEHAHLARYDDWLRLLQCGIVAIAGVHPAVRLIARQIDLEREAACDDRVVLRAGDPRSYAHCLATVAGLVTGVDRMTAAVVPLAVRSGSGLRARVTRLLEQRSNRTAGLGRGATLASLTALLLALFVSDRLPPVVVVDALRSDVTAEDAPDEQRTLSAMAIAAPFGAPLEPLSARPVARSAASFSVDARSPATTSSSTARQHSVDRLATVADAGSSSVQSSPRVIPIGVGIDSGPFDENATSEMIGPSGDRDTLPLASRELARVVAPGASGLADAATGDDVRENAGHAAGVTGAGLATGQQMKRFGQSVGSSSRRAGTSVGRFFSRASRSMASGF